MPLTDRQRAARKASHERRLAAAAAVIPAGPYCYTSTGRTIVSTTVIGDDGVPRTVAPFRRPAHVPCPFQKTRGDWPSQADGYCRLHKAGDNAKHRNARTDLLWDQVKACGINDARAEPADMES